MGLISRILIDFKKLFNTLENIYNIIVEYLDISILLDPRPDIH